MFVTAWTVNGLTEASLMSTVSNKRFADLLPLFQHATGIPSVNTAECHMASSARSSDPSPPKPGYHTDRRKVVVYMYGESVQQLAAAPHT